MQKTNALQLAKTPVHASIDLPGSKSLSNRVLLIAALACGRSKITNLPTSKDVQAGIGALKSLGVVYLLSKDQTEIEISGCGGSFPTKNARVFCNEAGTLTRFIVPLAAAQTQGEYYIYAAKRMMERPIAQQLEILNDLGLQASYEHNAQRLPMTIHAKGLTSVKKVSIQGDKSSQFLSGLLIAAPFIKNGLTIESQTNHPQPYVKMTTDMMQFFGVDIIQKDNQYTVKNHSYQAKDYAIEPDLSTASYFWALALLTGGEVHVKNVKKQAKQGDIRFLEVLAKMGATVVEENQGISVIATQTLKGVTVNMRNFSDTFMTVAVLACFAQGQTHISGLSHTRLQESDRVFAMEEGLKKLGVKVESTQDTLHIYPQESNLQSAEVQGHNDHRIAMSLALIGARVPGVVINGSQCVAKTCPDYFERMNALINMPQNTKMQM